MYRISFLSALFLMVGCSEREDKQQIERFEYLVKSYNPGSDWAWHNGSLSRTTFNSGKLLNADIDGDGVAAIDDLDDDNDGIPDSVEMKGVDPTGDADGDTVPNWLDADNDGTGNTPNCDDSDPIDGFCDDNVPSTYLDQDRDGIPNHLDLDSDNDSIPDVVEAGHGVDPGADGLLDGPYTNGLANSVDASGDGTIDYIVLDSDGGGTADYLDVDGDNDGVPDIVEAGNGHLDPGGDGTIDGPIIDADGDGLEDSVDADNTLFGAPAVTSFDLVNSGDTDGDGIPDLYDVDGGGPGAGDSDDDGIPDDVECIDGWPDCTDSDSDGTPDYLTPLDTDGDGAADNVDTDDDNDGVADNVDTAPLDPFICGDSDNDTCDDCAVGSDDFGPNSDSNPSNDGTDADSDGICDAGDVDDDNDGILDSSENLEGVNPDGDTDEDGVPNYLDADGYGDGGSLECVDAATADGICDVIVELFDTDGDGVPNHRDLDSDNDGIPDNVEAGHGAFSYPGTSGTASCGSGVGNNGYCGDLEATGDSGVANYALLNTDAAVPNGDEIPDFLDSDSDADGAFDIEEVTALAIFDGDDNGIIDTLFVDDDGDGLAKVVDENDASWGSPTDATDPTADDIDGDSIPDLYDGEVATGGDSDGDGINDSVECPSGWPCLDSDGDGTPDYMAGGADADEDGIPDGVDPDDDNDGVYDVFEAGGVDPSLDGDGDGIPNYLDADDIGDGRAPTCVDGNVDGICDDIDVLFDQDGDGIANHLDIDADNDTISDEDELGGPAGSEPVDTDMDGVGDWLDTDSDNDGIPDSMEAGDDNLDTPPIDTDGDTAPDAIDLDSDDDGVADAEESGGLDDIDGDGLIDYLDPDSDGDGINDDVDNCTHTPNPSQFDSDSDGVGAMCESVGDPDFAFQLGGAGGCSVTQHRRNGALGLLFLLSCLGWSRKKQERVR